MLLELQSSRSLCIRLVPTHTGFTYPTGFETGPAVLRSRGLDICFPGRLAYKAAASSLTGKAPALNFIKVKALNLALYKRLLN